MIVKLVTLFVCLSSTAWAAYNGPLAGGLPASLYPAGVSPQACPNFPNCANPAVAAQPNSAIQSNQWGSPQPQWAGQQQPQPQWTQQPQAHQQQWNSPNQWNPNNQNALDRGEYIGDGDYHGEGLAEALAPGYENSGGWKNWDNGNHQQQQAAPAWNHGLPAGVPPPPGAPAHSIPAGVDPGSCPNYPFCH